MADQSNLEALYVEAQSALKGKEYDRAAELLTQIIAVDENYKDVSRLLAQAVRLKRRRWYGHPALWGTLGALILIGLGVAVIPKLTAPAATQAPTQASTSTATLVPPSPTATVVPTQTLIPAPTPIPLTWKRISIGQEFQRDIVTAFATDKKDPDVIYAGMKNSGVYKTIDGGLSWRPAHYGLGSTQVESLLIDSQNPQILYAGTMDGVFKTENGGENWFRIGEGTYLLMDWQDNSHIYARDDNGIYETTNQGNTWTTAYALNANCPGTIRSWAIHPRDGNMLFMGGGEECEPGVYHSTDSGRSWTLIGMEGKPDIDPLIISLDKSGNYSIYATYNSTLPGRPFLYTSYDGGLSWSILSEGDFSCEILALDPDNPSVLYCGKDRIYVMQKKGDGWRALPGTQSIAYSAIHIDTLNGASRIITGGANRSNQSNPYVGVFISTDAGNSWEERYSGLGSARAELKIDPLDSARMYLATYFADERSSSRCSLYRSQDRGKSWSLIKGGYGSWCGPTFDAAHVLYLIESRALQKSFDGGDTWLWERDKFPVHTKEKANEDAKQHANGLPNHSSAPYGTVAQSLSANPYLEGFVFDVGYVIGYSADAGYSWQLSEGSKDSWDARLFYADQSKMIFDIGRYQQKYSTDNGKTWQNCGEDVATSRSDSRLALDLQGERLYLATPGQGVLVSADKCQSWQPSNNGLTNLFVNTLALDPNNSNTVYAGTDGGAYISYDAGATWGQVNDGLLGATVVYSIVVDKDGVVYAATPYGIFKLEKK